MVYELMYRLVLDKKYQLQEIYDLIEDYCIDNDIADWKHKVRVLIKEKIELVLLASMKLHIMVIAFIQLINERKIKDYEILRN